MQNLNPVSTDYLSPTQMKGLLRLGDVLIPGAEVTPTSPTGEGLPSFSESGCAAGVDRMLAYMYDDDRMAFQFLVSACAYLPNPAIKAIVASASANKKLPEPLAMLMRMANLGIKGVVHSLYYSNLGQRVGAELTHSPAADPASAMPNIHRIIGYDTTINQAAFEAALADAQQRDEIAQQKEN